MAGQAEVYCLDSWAVPRFLERRSPAARRVRQVMHPEITRRAVGCTVEDLAR